LAFFVAPTGNNNLSTLLGKRECRRPSDARQPSRNQNNLRIHRVFSLKNFVRELAYTPQLLCLSLLRFVVD
jgi:hypothetical protein